MGTVSEHPSGKEQGHALVFDSGVGGLTVAREILALAPGVAVDYAADTGFFPCLLYTSPSPRDLSTSRMPSSA